jgi:phosphate transport system protein
MSRHLQREIENLKNNILAISARVEEGFQKAVRSVEERDAKLGQDVIEDDPEIDRMEVELEEDCLKVLALHQPVARDLRFIVAILKINNDLERIGDLAVNIAERGVFLANHEKTDTPYNLLGLAEDVRAMLRGSIDALVNMDTKVAHQVCASDDKVDETNREMYDQVKDAIRKNPDKIEILINFLSISRYLERIADHATNIAEDVIYMNEGAIVRHWLDEQ